MSVLSDDLYPFFCVFLVVNPVGVLVYTLPSTSRFFIGTKSWKTLFYVSVLSDEMSHLASVRKQAPGSPALEASKAWGLLDTPQHHQMLLGVGDDVSCDSHFIITRGIEDNGECCCVALLALLKVVYIRCLNRRAYALQE